MTAARPFITAINPYHLATREPPAMAALVLGTRSVTLMPRPVTGDTKQCVADAVQAAPRYLRLMEAWRWTGALWRAGVVSAGIAAERADSDLPAVYGDIRNQTELAEIKPLTRAADALADERPAVFLDALANDLLRGGPDPGISIPVNAALERFCARHGVVMVRGAASSVAQRAESRLGTKVFSVAIPMLLRAGGERVLLLRHDLSGPLRSLRSAIRDGFERPDGPASLPGAAARFGDAFNEWSEQWKGRGDDESGHRVMTGYLGITGMTMPADAVLLSSRVAVRSVGGSRAAGRPGQAVSTIAEPPMQRTLIIREMNIRPGE